MKKKKNSALGLMILASLLLMISCEPTLTAVTFESAVQTGGTSGTVDSTGLILTFSVDPTSLTADNITVTGATKGTLSVTGTTRTLAISNITVANGETVSVAIADPSEFTISGSPQTTVVYKDIRVRVTYNAGTGNTSGTVPEDVTAYDVDDEVTVLGDTGDLKGEIIYDTTHMQFLGWNTQANGEGDMYYEGNTFTITEDTSLYAIYTALRVEGPAGGLIFYDKGEISDNWRYLEAAPQSTEWTSAEWGKFGTEVTETGTAIGTGENNTRLICDVLNAPTADSGRAAQLCDALEHVYEEVTYDDWFLPSKDELYEMCWVLHSRRWNGSSAEDNPVYGSSRVGGFASGYWSSSEFSSENAWSQAFLTGLQGNYSKGFTGKVRAVRAF